MKRLGLLLLVALALLVPDLAPAQSFRTCTMPTNTLAVSSVSNSVQLGACGPVVIVYNTGTVPIFYRVGAVGLTAVGTDTPIPASTYQVINVPINAATGPYFAAIASTSATLYFGQGRIVTP